VNDAGTIDLVGGGVVTDVEAVILPDRADGVPLNKDVHLVADFPAATIWLVTKPPVATSASRP